MQKRSIFYQQLQSFGCSCPLTSQPGLERFVSLQTWFISQKHNEHIKTPTIRFSHPALRASPVRIYDAKMSCLIRSSPRNHITLPRAGEIRFDPHSSVHPLPSLPLSGSSLRDPKTHRPAAWSNSPPLFSSSDSVAQIECPRSHLQRFNCSELYWKWIKMTMILTAELRIHLHSQCIALINLCKTSALHSKKSWVLFDTQILGWAFWVNFLSNFFSVWVVFV